MSSSYTIPFDDTYSAFIYQPADAWFAQTWNASNVGQTGTFHFSDNLTAIVTFTFPAPAVAFSYFGFRRSSGGLYELCVDCDPGSPNCVNVDAFNSTDDGQNPPVLLYNQTFSTLAIHTVAIQNMADSRGSHPGNSELTMDRIELTVISSPSVVTTTLTASSTSTLTISNRPSVITTTFTASDSSTPTMSSTGAASVSTLSGHSSSTLAGTIVAVILCCAFALVIGVSLYRYRRGLLRAEHREDSGELSARSEALEDSSFRYAPVALMPRQPSSTIPLPSTVLHYTVPYSWSPQRARDAGPRLVPMNMEGGIL